MSKYLADDPWLGYVELPRGRQSKSRGNAKADRALAKRMARFRRGRKTKPLRFI